MRVLLAAVLLLTLGCNEDIFSPAYDPALPTAWSAAVTNSFFPLTPGTTYEFRSQQGSDVETIIIDILAETRMVNGVRATVVRDRAFLNNSLIEDTYDWFAQDAAGNVWYLGEDTKEVLNGQVVGTEGSWEWGKNGALPGIYMWANPAAHIGETYRQEFLKGEAEDWGKVLAVNVTVTVPSATYTGCIRTEDWPGLEPDQIEQKTYCPGVGLTLETAGSERVELTRVTRN